MHITRIIRSFALSVLLVGGLLAPLQTTHAAMFGTDSVLTGAQQALDRSELKLLLAREDVAGQLQQYGVDPADALMRVERMTDREVASLNQKLGEVSAGSGFISAAVTIFVVLVITDVLGATDVFSFVRPII